MQISVQVVYGQSSKNTFTLLVTIGGKQGIALLDTGSTHTFMDLKFSTKIQCSTVHTSLETVLVAGGGALQTGAQVQAMDYVIQGHTFNNPFKILSLKGYDLVLGGDWMLRHSPVKFDYLSRQVKIRCNGQQKLLLKDYSLKQGVQLMSMDKLDKELKKGATGYYLFPLSTTATPDDSPDDAAI
jgi:hypothetical protein